MYREELCGRELWLASEKKVGPPTGKRVRLHTCTHEDPNSDFNFMSLEEDFRKEIPPL